MKKLRLATLLALAFAAPVFALPREARLASPPTIAAPHRVDVNSANATALGRLPGVGKARAKAIIAGRPYTEKRQLVARRILPARLFAMLEDRIALVDLNTASAAALAAILPRVGPRRAAAIVGGRRYTTPQDLVAKGVMSARLFAQVAALVTVG